MLCVKDVKYYNFFSQKFKTIEITVVSQGALVHSLAPAMTLRLDNGT